MSAGPYTWVVCWEAAPGAIYFRVKSRHRTPEAAEDALKRRRWALDGYPGPLKDYQPTTGDGFRMAPLDPKLWGIEAPRVGDRVQLMPDGRAVPS